MCRGQLGKHPLGLLVVRVAVLLPGVNLYPLFSFLSALSPCFACCAWRARVCGGAMRGSLPPSAVWAFPYWSRCLFRERRFLSLPLSLLFVFLVLFRRFLLPLLLLRVLLARSFSLFSLSFSSGPVLRFCGMALGPWGTNY